MATVDPQVPSPADLRQMMETFPLEKTLATVGVVVVGFLVARLSAKVVLRLLGPRLSSLQVVLLSRLAWLLVLLLTTSVALKLWGQNVTVLFGAAGILTLAIGFASQTSASNLIAGFFLMAERSFSVGDVIQVESFVGEVVSIDLLSVKLRKFDNILVRIPNEKLIRADVQTLTRYPIRRADVHLLFHRRVDLERVEQVLLEAVALEPLVLVEPPPEFAIEGVVEGCASVRFSVWTARASFVQARTSAVRRCLHVLREEGIGLSGPRRSIEVESGSIATVDPGQAPPDTDARSGSAG